jgi:hypothetical protein
MCNAWLLGLVVAVAALERCSGMSSSLPSRQIATYEYDFMVDGGKSHDGVDTASQMAPTGFVAEVERVPLGPSLTDSTLAFFELKLSNIRPRESIHGRAHTYNSETDIDADFERPFYFTQAPDGRIVEVLFDRSDSLEVGTA